jgi:hypothetical protein
VLGLRGLFSEGFCDTADHLVDVIEDAAHSPELALRCRRRGAGALQMPAELVELLDAMSTAAVRKVRAGFPRAFHRR